MRTTDTENEQEPEHAVFTGARNTSYSADNPATQPRTETTGEGREAQGEFRQGAELWLGLEFYQDQTAARGQASVQYYSHVAQGQMNTSTNTGWQPAFPGYDPTGEPFQAHTHGAQVSLNAPLLNTLINQPPLNLPPTLLGNTDSALSVETQPTILPRQCIHCLRVFPSNNKLLRHIRSTHWGYKYRCWCGSESTRKDNHLQHWERHSNRGERYSPATAQSSMMCGVCGETTVDAGEHRIHVQSCGDGVPGRPSGSKNAAQ
ncbi:hypothetical protein GGTG_08948 [Gaeumannomyces tritici R3-111a-1]|uniref:C2H2-type domain-containing protein n=1 Tax=Gaeumannomyces tritici (strain R3-111a-1) TaxID=644352 RepID=J3P608_GAET3|nr:hypothetical protein GGTG_08948 [Gaeumannomyces tritici R3-111a-1]EJT75110.1 hypothetical protein GGTG_08948 [Gaeumannomyces tritici R3-111a-1]